jgi:photosystem II stability/assembly factor-like uncharacterized protein
MPAAAVLLALLAPWPASGETIFGLVDTGELYASTNGGSSWSFRAPLPARDAVDLVAGSAAGELYLVTETGALHRSTNGGMTWNLLSLFEAVVAALLEMAGEFHVFTGTLETFRSTDGGVTFTALGTAPASDVVSAARDLFTLFVLTRTGVVFKSTDHGVTWSVAGVTPPTSEAVEIRIFRGALYVLTESGELSRSLDRGASWTTVSTISQVGMCGMATTRTELLATTTVGEVAVTPTGLAWTWRGTIGQLTVRTLGTDIPGVIGIEPSEAPPPPSIALAAPWPNPAHGEVFLALDLERPGTAAIDLYDALGRKWGTPLAEESLPAGRTEIRWSPTGLPRGEYWLRARVGQVGWRSVPGENATGSSRKLVWLGRR